MNTKEFLKSMKGKGVKLTKEMVEERRKKLKVPVKISSSQKKKVFSWLIKRSMDDLMRIPAGPGYFKYLCHFNEGITFTEKMIDYFFNKFPDLKTIGDKYWITFALIKAVEIYYAIFVKNSKKSIKVLAKELLKKDYFIPYELNEIYGKYRNEIGLKTKRELEKKGIVYI